MKNRSHTHSAARIGTLFALVLMLAPACGNQKNEGSRVRYAGQWLRG
jgi:hypothetical protein